MHAWSLKPPHALSPAKPKQISYIILHSFSFFISSLHIRPSRSFPEYLNALCPGFHRAQASPSAMRCRGTDSNAEVHVQSYRHPRCTRFLILTSLSLFLSLLISISSHMSLLSSLSLLPSLFLSFSCQPSLFLLNNHDHMFSRLSLYSQL